MIQPEPFPLALINKFIPIASSLPPAPRPIASLPLFNRLISQGRRNPNRSTSSPMADSDPALSPPPAATLSSPSETDDLQPAGATIADLDKSQSDLLGRLQGLKQDLHNWRSKLDTQVRTYKDELSDLKKSLNTELEQLRSDFQELRTTLQKQQEDVTASLRNLGMEDAPANSEEREIQVQEDNSEKSQSPSMDNATKINPSDGPVAESSP